MCIFGAYIILSHRGVGGWGVRGTDLFFGKIFRNIPTYLCEIPVTIIVKCMKHFLCPSHRLIPKIYFLTTKMLQLFHTVTVSRGKRFKTSSIWTLILCVTWNGNVVEKDHSVSWYAATGIPGEVILEDHDEYLDHLLELHRPRPVLVIQTELPPELLLRRTRGLCADCSLHNILSNTHCFMCRYKKFSKI